ncbi:MAG: carboxylating nicotinate-nucleotide diphosphorylase [Deltaproteobacteria bacterium]|nr:carboxylating nicotinate-nucleotide diphosphorylase [Deltaproteobacteria bacterium]
MVPGCFQLESLPEQALEKIVSKVNIPQVDKLIALALAEDVGVGDETTRLTVPPDLYGRAAITAKQSLTVAGLPVCARVFELVDYRCLFESSLADGMDAAKGMLLAEVSGPVNSILTAERTALNFLQRLSGIATLTRAYVEAVVGTTVHIVDTRKTTPGWRAIEKYAVRMGGGRNHRYGLFDGILIKDNHIKAAGGVAKAIAKALAQRVHLHRVEVEVTNLEELAEAVTAGAEVIMLDNMTVDQVIQAVKSAGGVPLEVSGNINLNTVRSYAETGVDFISVGAVTHSAPAADISLNLI